MDTCVVMLPHLDTRDNQVQKWVMTFECPQDFPAALCDEHFFGWFPRYQDALAARPVSCEDSLPALTLMFRAFKIQRIKPLPHSSHHSKKCFVKIHLLYLLMSQSSDVQVPQQAESPHQTPEQCVPVCLLSTKIPAERIWLTCFPTKITPMPRPSLFSSQPRSVRCVYVSFNFLDFVGAENHTMIYTNRDVPIDPW